MWSPFRLLTRFPELALTRERIGRLEAQLAALQEEAVGLQELAAHLDGEWELFRLALDRLRPGLPEEQLAAELLELSFRPFELAAFYLVRMDWEADTLHFVHVHEGGRLRAQPSHRLSKGPGLTGRTLLEGRSLYVRNLQEGERLGAILTETERASGLVPQTWFGVPVGQGPRPWGLAAFQCFQPDALPPLRRRRLEALVRLLALALPRAA